MSDGRVWLEEWVEGAAEAEGFWQSAPDWRTEVARRDCEGVTIAWTDFALFSVAQPAAAVMGMLDGAVSLAELAEDLAAVAEAPREVARRVVASAALELMALGAIEGVEAPEMPQGVPESAAVEPVAQDQSERTVVDPDSGEEIRVVEGTDGQGNPVTTEYLPDGRTRVTTSLTFGADAQSQATLAAAIAGERSMAELVPNDSCLGSKLRNHDEVPLLSFVCTDGAVRSVRCHDVAVAEGLRALAAESLVADRRGPIVAFVVTPLEGDGPRRVFDGLGRRRGRPRSTAETVALVDQILGESTTTSIAAVSRDVIPLRLATLSGTARPTVLAPIGQLYERGAAARLRAAGWEISWAEAVLDAEGGLVAPRAFGAVKPSSDEVVVAVAGGDELPLAGRLLALVEPQAVPAEQREATLDSLIGLAQRVRWTSVDGSLHELLGDLAGASSHG